MKKEQEVVSKEVAASVVAVVDEHQEQYKNDTVVETKVSMSKDGNWIIHKTVTTVIKHKNYYKAMLEASK